MNDFNIKQILTISNPHKDKISSVQFHPTNNDLLASSCNKWYNQAADKTFKLFRINDNKSEYIEEADYKFHAYGINQIKGYYLISNIGIMMAIWLLLEVMIFL